MISPVAVIYDEDGNEVLGKTTDAAAPAGNGTAMALLKAIRDALGAAGGGAATEATLQAIETLLGAGLPLALSGAGNLQATLAEALPAGNAAIGRVRDELAAPTPGGGTYAAQSATLSGAGTVSAPGRCVGCRLFAPTGGDAVVEVSFVTGDVTVREGTGVDLNPKGIPVDPVVTWKSGTVDVIVETVT